MIKDMTHEDSGKFVSMCDSSKKKNTQSVSQPQIQHSWDRFQFYHDLDEAFTEDEQMDEEFQ